MNSHLKIMVNSTPFGIHFMNYPYDIYFITRQRSGAEKRRGETRNEDISGHFRGESR